MKTVRFTQIVERCGRPRIHALWVDPARDPEFSRARKTDRVMTLAPTAQGKADVGTVGFDATHPSHSRFLIFPRSLKPFAGARVVGVKFDLIEQPRNLSPAEHERWKPPPKKKRPVQAALSEAEQRQSPASSPAEQADPRQRAVKPLRTAATERPRRAPPSRARREHRVSALERAVRAALGELQLGKTVAAYQRLERALAAESHGA